MSLLIPSTDLTWMRSAQDGHMNDTCVLQACVQTDNTFGEAVETWPVDGSAIACGLDMRPGSERHGTENTVINYDATIRLPIAQTPDPKDHIKVTKRFGETLATALVFSIVGPIQRGPSGIRLLLERIQT